MSRFTQSLIISIIVVIVIIIIAAYIWYNFMGWKPFSYKTNDKVSWKPDKNKNISQLRFKDVKYSVLEPNGTQHTYDVTAVLNGMAVAYENSDIQIPKTLNLDKNLNSFSFQIPGVNDSRTLQTKDQVERWRNNKVTLVGKVRSL